LERAKDYHEAGCNRDDSQPGIRGHLNHPGPSVMKRLLTALLIISITTIPIRPAKSAGYAVGVIVICAGGYCVYRLVKVCQKVFPPKTTNSPPSLSASGDEYAGAYEYSSVGSCYEPPQFNAASAGHNPTTFTLNVIVERAGVTTSMSANSQEGTAQSWAEFQADMASHGLFITGHPAVFPQFSRNGVPCDSAMVPLEFNYITGRVINVTGGDLRRVVVERSIDLIAWSQLLTTDVGVGTGFKVEDTTAEGSMFYRVQVSQP
jgi:hypothetical protein